jgi:division protein CdvB (Snf7/Vps24/ESCRT-III family)
MTRAYDKNTEYNNAREILLIEKIYQSFETLEEILEKLKLEEPLFMIKTAKRSFANNLFKQIEFYNERPITKRYLN